MKSLIEWLRPQLNEACNALKPDLVAILSDKGPAVDFTQDDIEALIADLYPMEGEEGEDLEAYKKRLREEIFVG